jgi:hypothetical protein
MSLHQFRLIVDQLPTDQQVDALFTLPDEPSAGGSPREGLGIVWFDRDAPTLADAIASGVRDLVRLGMRPVRVENRDWVTLGAIADRIGRSREIVRLWSTGRQGPGGFPPPLNPDRDPKTAFYSWAEVSVWLLERMRLDVPDAEPILAAANLALQLRGLAEQVEQQGVIAELVGFRCGGGGRCVLGSPETALAA